MKLTTWVRWKHMAQNYELDSIDIHKTFHMNELSKTQHDMITWDEMKHKCNLDEIHDLHEYDNMGEKLIWMNLLVT